MDLTRREIRGVSVVEVYGKLIGDPENAKVFHEFFKSFIDDEPKDVVIDLEDTPWANSVGIGMLIGVYTSLKKTRRNLVLANPGDRIRDILSVTRLSLIFRSFDSVDDAVDYLLMSARRESFGNYADNIARRYMH